MKKNRLIIIILLLSHFCFSANIGVIYRKEIKSFKSIIKVFMDEMKEVSDHDIIDLGFKLEESNAFSMQMINHSIDYVFSVGVNAAKICNEGSYRGVFTMVLDPYKAGLINENNLPTKNLAGIFVQINPLQMLDFVELFYSSSPKRGCLFHHTQNNYFISNYDSVLYGNQLHQLDLIPIESKNDLFESMNMNKDKINFILSNIDRKVYNGSTIPIILRFSILNKIPFFGYSKKHTQAGALASIETDYEQLGLQAVQLILNIISGHDPKTIKIQYPEKVNYSINKRILSVLKIKMNHSKKNELENIEFIK